jgi:hypothetical protein
LPFRRFLPHVSPFNGYSTANALKNCDTTRYKAIIGPRLRARGFAAQQTEAAIGCAVLNRS